MYMFALHYDCVSICRSLKELLLERATVVVKETQETKPLAAVTGGIKLII